MKQQFTQREIEREATRLARVAWPHLTAAVKLSPDRESLRRLALDSLRRKAQYRRRLEHIAYGPRGLARVEALRMLKRS